ncbi:hypothetical protein Emed_001118 [Eimeria media]
MKEERLIEGLPREAPAAQSSDVSTEESIQVKTHPPPAPDVGYDGVHGPDLEAKLLMTIPLVALDRQRNRQLSTPGKHRLSETQSCVTTRRGPEGALMCPSPRQSSLNIDGQNSQKRTRALRHGTSRPPARYIPYPLILGMDCVHSLAALWHVTRGGLRLCTYDPPIDVALVERTTLAYPGRAKFLTNDEHKEDKGTATEANNLMQREIRDLTSPAASAFVRPGLKHYKGYRTAHKKLPIK